MTSPSLLPLCAVYVDGVRMADGQVGEPDETPVVLTDLGVTWGRSNTLDQPGPASATFTVLDMLGGQEFTSILKIGSRISIRAEATIFPDPTESVMTNPGFESGALGSTPSSRVINAQVVISATKAHAGARSARVSPVNAATGITVVFPPAPFSANVSAWDAIPRTFAGQTWRFGASVNLAKYLSSPAAFQVRPVYFTSPVSTVPYAIDGSVAGSQPPADANGWVVSSGDVVPPADRWVGIAVTIGPTGPRWTDVPVGTTWNSLTTPSPSWLELAYHYVDDLVVLAPAEGAQRSAAVFDGRITDLEARYDLDVGGTKIDVIAQDDLAELANRYVGATPYSQESLSARFGRIVTDSGQVIAYTIDAAVKPISVSYQDVDSQPAAGLLQMLAQSVAGVLWESTSIASGPFLRLEDVNSRPPLNTLTMTPPPLQNLFSKPSFEDGLTTNFSPTGGTLAVVTTSQPPVPGRSGTKLLRMTSTGTAQLDIGMANAIKPPATVGKQYRVSAYVRAGQTPAVGSAQLIAEYRDVGNVLVAGTQVTGPATVLAAGAAGWKRLEVTLGAAPANAVTLTFNLRVPTGTGIVAGSLVDWEAILVHDVTEDPGQATAEFFDGDSPADATVTHVWDGAQWASTSTRFGMYSVVPQSVLGANGITLDACNALLEPVRWRQDSQDASTRVAVTWKEQTANPSPPPAIKPTDRTTTATDGVAESSLGRRRVGVSTMLTNETDATSIANLYLARLSVPGWRLSGVEIDLSVEEIDAELLDVVMQILDGATRPGLPILLVNLPEWSPVGESDTVALYLEGGRFVNIDGYWTLSLVVSDAAAQGKSLVRWIDNPPGVSWLNYGEIAWNDLLGVAI